MQSDHREIVRGMLRASALAALAGGLLVLAAGPALADADGNPNLDPNGGAGTLYDFVAKGVALSLDPGMRNGATGTVRGELTITQDPGEGEFHAFGTWDSDADGIPNGVLTCEGVVGQGRFGMACEGTDDDGGDVHLLLLGKANESPSGKITLKKTQGTGILSWGTLKLVFAAQSK